jgi:hypothetical protein
VNLLSEVAAVAGKLLEAVVADKSPEAVRVERKMELVKPDTQKGYTDSHPDLGNQTDYRHLPPVANNQKRCRFELLKTLFARIKAEWH